MTKSTLIPHLKAAVADHYVLAVKLQNYHWHVTGPNFLMLHEMFGGRYEKMAAAIDLLAERLRALQECAPATLKEFLALAQQTEGSAKTAPEMLKDLLKSHEQLVVSSKKIHEIASETQDCATTKILEDLIEEDEKFCWMLRSTL